MAPTEVPANPSPAANASGAAETVTESSSTPSVSDSNSNPSKCGGRRPVWRVALSGAGSVARKLLVPDYTGVSACNGAYSPPAQRVATGGWSEEELRRAMEASLEGGDGLDEQDAIEKALQLSLAEGGGSGGIAEKDDFEVALAMRGKTQQGARKLNPNDDEDLDVFHPRHPAQQKSSDAVSSSSSYSSHSIVTL
mmetsp:Transcript_92703/g.294101  ORF Transcript_92703/g.294101 Transcript_92703/m.294101 type:complete len:195 (-) Transcript_92703:41-625(-)